MFRRLFLCYRRVIFRRIIGFLGDMQVHGLMSMFFGKNSHKIFEAKILHSSGISTCNPATLWFLTTDQWMAMQGRGVFLPQHIRHLHLKRFTAAFLWSNVTVFAFRLTIPVIQPDWVTMWAKQEVPVYHLYGGGMLSAQTACTLSILCLKAPKTNRYIHLIVYWIIYKTEFRLIKQKFRTVIVTFYCLQPPKTAGREVEILSSVSKKIFTIVFSLRKDPIVMFCQVFTSELH